MTLAQFPFFWIFFPRITDRGLTLTQLDRCFRKYDNKRKPELIVMPVIANILVLAIIACAIAMITWRT